MTELIGAFMTALAIGAGATIGIIAALIAVILLGVIILVIVASGIE